MKNKVQFIKSPMNYTGNKYKLLPQLYNFFPSNINNFVDLFVGGTDVSINTQATHKFANDINTNIISIYLAFQKHSIEEIMQYIDSRIKEFQLTRFNSNGFYQYRDLYNTDINYKTPLDLFTLSRFSFNNKISFNTNNEYNGSFGYNHSDFNLTQRGNTRAMHSALQGIQFSSLDFREFNLSILNKPNDFLYVDPPYLISDAQYNTGPKSINSRWTVEDDIALYDFLDKASNMGIKWALSNVMAHKGQENITLMEWSERYYVYDIFSDYSRAVYNKTKTAEPTIEVLVTNYEK